MPKLILGFAVAASLYIGGGMTPADDPQAAMWNDVYFEQEPPIGVQVSPTVLPPLVCDEVPDGWSEGLIANGWSAELADRWGEALMSPDGRVVVTFAC